MPLKPSFLSARIGLLFGLVTALAFGAMGTYLYRSHDRQMQEHDDKDLVEKVALLRRQLLGFRTLDAIRAPADGLPVLVVGHEGVAVALKDKDGNVLIETEPGAAAVPAVNAVPADRAPGVDSIEESRGSGVTRRSVAAWGRIASPSAEPVLIAVSRDDSMRAALLRAYGEDLTKAVIVSALAAALLGYVVARRGLRPVRDVARAARDISVSRLGGRLQIEDAPAELADLASAFNGMLDRLEDSFRRLSQFSSDMAHDLRTPIANLVVQTQVTLGQPRAVSEYETLLASNLEEYERLTRMIENMLFLARADNAQVALQRQLIPAAEEELSRVAEYFEGLAAEAGVTVEVVASGALNADPVLFRRAVGNLVSNALRYTPRGERITITGRPEGKRAYVVNVSNPGPAIAPEHLPRIFDRFYRVDEARCDSQASSGLGLAIVKSIVTLHGGEVRVESSAEKGLTGFFLVFRWQAA